MPTLNEQLRALSEDYKAGILTREEFDAFKAELLRTASDPGRNASSSQAAPAPERIAEYRVLRKLGAGGMGTVYLAENMVEGLARREGRVAIKVIHRHLVAEPGIRERFLAEAQNSTVIEHPNLVRVHRYLPDHDALVMEYVEGATLAAVLARGPLDWEAAVSAFQGVLDAVAAFHGRRPPIVHRDLKPGNIMVAASGIWKVMDFGLARDLGGVGTGTSSHGALGTMAYMPPEQAEHPKDVDPRWDVYALGLVLWEILTGSAAWRDVDSGIQLFKRKERDQFLDVGLVPEGVPGGLVGVARAACRADSSGRYAHAGAMRNNLELAFQKALVERNLLDSVPRPAASRPVPNLAGRAEPRKEPERVPRAEPPVKPQPAPPVKPQPAPPVKPQPAPPVVPPAPQPVPFAAPPVPPPSGSVPSQPVDLPARRVSPQLVVGIGLVGGAVVLGVVIALAVAVSRVDKPVPAMSQAPAVSQSPVATPVPTSSKLVDIDWVSIPGGSFQMGSTEGSSDEQPVHTVTLRAFEMSRTEVTVGQYKACVDAGSCTADTGGTCNWGVPVKEQHPVNCVDWAQAGAFAKWAGGRLPSEAEWEYAARAGQNTTYAGSNSPDEVAWYSANSDRVTHAVGLKKANAWGLYDMSGNVWEWVQDWHHESYAGAPTDGSAWESPPSSGRVNRGGCYLFTAGIRVADRSWLYSANGRSDLGFRVIR